MKLLRLLYRLVRRFTFWLLRHEDVSSRGERVDARVKDLNYYIHLHVYTEALRYCQDKVVMDAGSGSGYGAYYLATHGARHVSALEYDEKAVRFSRSKFRHPRLCYERMDLQDIVGFADNSLDVIFTSNVLEHVPDVRKFLNQAVALLKPDGMLFAAVPMIDDGARMDLETRNVFHLNNWTHTTWKEVFSSLFEEVDHFGQTLKPGVHTDQVNLTAAPKHVLMRTDSWTLERIVDVPPYEYDIAKHPPVYGGAPKTYTNIIFVAKRPRKNKLEQIVLRDDSYTRQPASIVVDDVKTWTDEIGADTAVIQSFVAGGSIAEIDLRFDQCGETNARELSLEIRADLHAEKPLYRHVVNASQIPVGDWACFRFYKHPIRAATGRYFLLVRCAGGGAGAGLRLCMAHTDLPGGELLLSGKKVRGCLNLRVWQPAGNANEEFA